MQIRQNCKKIFTFAFNLYCIFKYAALFCTKYKTFAFNTELLIQQKRGNGKEKNIEKKKYTKLNQVAKIIWYPVLRQFFLKEN